MKDRNALDGLRQNMLEHIAYRKNSDTVNLLWSGYLAALLVEGHITPGEYHDLRIQLKVVGEDELKELFIGYPGQHD